MLTPSHLYCAIAVGILWTLWFTALGLERGWFRDVWRSWADMPPSAKAVMAVLCAYCTVIAQKPGNVNNSAVSPDTGQPAGGGVAQQQQTQPASSPTQPSLPATRGGPSGVRSGPSRVVLQATPAADLATLVDAPETARLRLVSDGSRQTEPGAAEQSLTRQFVPRQWQVVAVDFESPADLTEMFFGGTAGRPAWNRGWRGEIAEVVGFNTPPDADVRAGVANYLSIRWGLAPRHPASPEQRRAATDAGLSYGLVWGSALFLK